MQHIQRTAAKHPGVLFRQLHRLLKNVLPITAGRHQHPGFQISLDQSARSRRLRNGGVLKEDLQLERIHELQLVQRCVANRLALDQRYDFRAVRFRIVELNENPVSR